MCSLAANKRENITFVDPVDPDLSWRHPVQFFHDVATEIRPTSPIQNPVYLAPRH